MESARLYESVKSGEELVGEQSGQFEGSDAESKFVVKITGI